MSTAFPITDCSLKPIILRSNNPSLPYPPSIFRSRWSGAGGESWADREGHTLCQGRAILCHPVLRIPKEPAGNSRGETIHG